MQQNKNLLAVKNLAVENITNYIYSFKKEA